MTLPKPNEFMLENGATVKIRPVMPEDAIRLQNFVLRLSPETRYYRFLEYIKELPETQAAAFAQVDYRQSMAFVASIEIDGSEQIIAVARYAVLDEQKPHLAEVAIVVEDAYQSQGLGTYLIISLTQYALEQGITQFTGSISPTNARILDFITRTGLKFERRYASGIWEVIIYLS